MRREPTSYLPTLGHDDALETIRRVGHEQTDFEQLEELPKDIENIHALMIDASAESRLASTLVNIMMEFYQDGEPFQPNEDAQLRLWLEATLARENPDISDADIMLLLGEVEGFPPKTRLRSDYTEAA